MKVLYFSPVEWNWIKQRPHFMAEALASEGNEVHFCSRSPWGKKAFWSKFRQESEKLLIRDFTVLPCALRFPWIEKWNARSLRKILFRENYDAVVLTDPRLVTILPGPEEFQTPVIYECMDRNSYFYEGKLREQIRKREEQLCRRAAAIVVSSNALKTILQEDFSVPPEKITVIRNAVADNLLDKVQINAQEPVDLLYAGTIDHWFDWDPVLAFAGRNPGRKIRIVGPAAVSPKKLPENIEMYGSVPHSEIPGLLQNASVLIMPFHPNDLIRAVDPVKMYEYLTFGKPVIASYWEELEFFRGNKNLYFYQEPEEFSAHAERLLETEAAWTADKAFLQANSWSKRGHEFNMLLKTLTDKPE